MTTVYIQYGVNTRCLIDTRLVVMMRHFIKKQQRTVSRKKMKHFSVGKQTRTLMVSN